MKSYPFHSTFLLSFFSSFFFLLHQPLPASELLLAQDSLLLFLPISQLSHHLPTSSLFDSTLYTYITMLLSSYLNVTDAEAMIRMCKGRSIYLSIQFLIITDLVTENVSFLNPLVSYGDLRIVTWTEDDDKGAAVIVTDYEDGTWDRCSFFRSTIYATGSSTESNHRAIENMLELLQARVAKVMPRNISHVTGFERPQT